MNPGPGSFHTAVLETTWGPISILAGSRGVRECRLPGISGGEKPFRVTRVVLPRGAPAHLRRAAMYARILVEGGRPGRCPRLDESVFRAAPSFRRAVWTALQRIPRGRTVSYSALAGLAGAPRAARAAGSACGANPLPLFVPCHRAVAANGGRGGFSAGLSWKLRLLAGEGVVL